MPDRRRHRGPHPGDAERFAAARVPALAAAVAELSWLFDRGYAQTAALKLVGDRHALDQRQRTAVRRAACADAAVAARRARRVSPAAAAGALLAIDGFNVLTTIEAALAGGALLACRDGCHRDMASMHGSYRQVEETAPALAAIGATLAGLRPARCRWLFDRPVSNSGRLAELLRATAAAHGWPWSAEVVDDPDRALRAAGAELVATADAAVLDACGAWLDLARLVIEAQLPRAWIVRLDRR